MIGKTKYAQNTLPYYGKKVLVIDKHVTGDIVTDLKKAHKDYRNDYDQIADEFWQGDAESTARLLFNVCKKHIKYDVEHPDNQQVKSPGAIFAQKHGDCKHYASVINGVIHSLNRKGYNVKCMYRFVADTLHEHDELGNVVYDDNGKPKIAEVHHVFAVVSDGVNEFWVDPVLKEFNTQPIFYNTKDVNMCALYRVSGTNNDSRPQGLALVGNRGVGNIFKKIAHGLEVNAHNVAHGIQVNAANTGKGVKQTVKKVEHIALNVGLSPARNAFLSLLDLNAFNLATRMADALKNHGDQVKKEWDKLGGNQSKLVSAINNGLKHKAFYHKQAPPKKVSGTIGDYIEGMCEGRVPHHTMRVVQVPTMRHAYDIGPDHDGRMPHVSGIGEPVSIASLAALASAIVAVMAKFMKPDKGDQNAADAAKEGVANIITNASDAIDAGDVSKGTALLNAANQGAQALNTMNVSAGVGPDGTPAVTVSDFNHPQLTNAGTPTGPQQQITPTTDGSYSQADYNNSPDAGTPGGNATQALTQFPGKVVTDVANDFKEQVIKIWTNYKTPIVFTGVGILAYKILTRKKKKGAWF